MVNKAISFSVLFDTVSYSLRSKKYSSSSSIYSNIRANKQFSTQQPFIIPPKKIVRFFIVNDGGDINHTLLLRTSSTTTKD